MNETLLTYSGGQPLYADDLSFMQNSLSAMTNHLAKAFGDTYIVWGCLDEAKENVIAGAVCIGGKLYEVPALGLLGENKLCFREVQSDEREFEDGQRHNVKKSYEAYLSTDTSGSVANIDLKAARNVSSWTQEQWDDTPYIELNENEKSTGWFDPEIKRLKVPGGWVYAVVLKCTTSGHGSTFSGTIKGVRINNEITVWTFSGNTPIVVSIPSKEDTYYPQRISIYVPNTNLREWASPVASFGSGKNFLIQFMFFDPDVKVTRNYSEVFHKN